MLEKFKEAARHLNPADAQDWAEEDLDPRDEMWFGIDIGPSPAFEAPVKRDSR